MSLNNLNLFIGQTLISDHVREAVSNGQLEDVMRKFGVAEDAIAEIVGARTGSLPELYAYAEQLEARYEAESRSDHSISIEDFSWNAPVTGYTMP